MVCRLTWHAIGLEARFAGARCTRDSTLRSATVSGMIWTSLSGVRVGDPVAKMRWQVPSAKLVSSRGYRKLWLLATAIASPSRLLAESGPSGRITHPDLHRSLTRANA
jgi:hypothetical protein